MQGWQYVKELIYLRTIFQLTKLAFLRARERERKKHLNTFSSALDPHPITLDPQLSDFTFSRLIDIPVS